MIPAAAPPCTMVVLRAEGDLSHRKLMPALFTRRDEVEAAHDRWREP